MLQKFIRGSRRLFSSLQRRKQNRRRQALFLNSRPSAEKRLLILKLDSIGDYILFRNFISDVKLSDKYKDHRITLCGNIWWKELCEALDKECIDEFIWVDISKLGDFDYNMALSEQLFARNFDVAVTPTSSRSSHDDELMLQSGAKVKIAPAGDAVNINAALKARNDALYTEQILTDTLGFEFERNRNFFVKFAGSANTLAGPSIEQQKERSQKIVICPGAKELKRQWKPAYFYELAVFLRTHFQEVEFYICGSKGEAALAKAIQASGNAIQFTDLCGKLDLVALKDLIAGSRLVLCNDSAPYHLAAALDVPLICFSNGNHYQRFCPYPKAYHKKNLELFPPALHAEALSEEEVRQLQLKGSDLDIHQITPQFVIEQITASGFLK